MQGLVDAQPGEAAASQLTDLRVDSISHESLKKKKITLLLSLGLVDFRAEETERICRKSQSCLRSRLS